MNMKKKRILLVSVAAVATTMGAMAQGEYVCGDFHQHSAYTDGSWTIGAVMRKNMEYGLDWWANSEHGGAFATWGRHGGWDEVNGVQYMSDVKWNALSTRDGGTIIKGDNAESGNMWRWQSLSEFSIYDIIDARILYPEKLILQGYEYNPAGHEHADVCIIEGQFGEKPAAEALAELSFEFLLCLLYLYILFSHVLPVEFLQGFCYRGCHSLFYFHIVRYIDVCWTCLAYISF